MIVNQAEKLLVGCIQTTKAGCDLRWIDIRNSVSTYDYNNLNNSRLAWVLWINISLRLSLRCA